MHPDVTRQLAAERQSDLQRRARTLGVPKRPARRRRVLLGSLARYAGAPTGARTGT